MTHGRAQKDRTPKSSEWVTQVLETPQAMRALAHPLRLRLLSELRRRGPMTTTALAETLGTSTASVSYHADQLMTHGYIEQAPELARNKRESWWRASADETVWSFASFLGNDEEQEAVALFSREVVRLHLSRLAEYLDDAARWGKAWGEVSGLYDFVGVMSPEDVKQMMSEVEEVVRRWQNRPPTDPDNAGRATVVIYTFPRPL